MGGPAPAAQSVDLVKLVAMVDASKLAQAAGVASAAATGASAPLLKLAGPLPMLNNPGYGALDNLAIAAFVLLTILLLVRYGRGFLAHIAVLLGIVAGCALALGKMGFDKAGKAAWFDLVTPFAFGLPTFDPVMVPPRRLRRTEGRRGPARQSRYRACPSRQAGTRCQVAGANWVATPAKVC